MFCVEEEEENESYDEDDFFESDFLVQNINESLEDILNEFDTAEKNFSLTFKKRISCVCHTLQLVLKAIFDPKLPKNMTIKKVLKLCKKIRSSHQATAMLVELEGKSLLNPGETRWGTTYIMVSRVLEVQEGLKKVMD